MEIHVWGGARSEVREDVSADDVDTEAKTNWGPFKRPHSSRRGTRKEEHHAGYFIKYTVTSSENKSQFYDRRAAKAEI